jgi:hypothetical protein
MTSPEQIEANRRNAALSTGPRTQDGKAASSLNGTRHGLLARELLVRGESEVDFAAFAQGVQARLAAVGELEIFVMNRVISSAWRLRRAVSVESAVFNSDAQPTSDDVSQGALGKIRLLSRYEVTLERSLYKGLEELAELQRKRERHELHEEQRIRRLAASAPDQADEDPDEDDEDLDEDDNADPDDEIGFVSQK